MAIALAIATQRAIPCKYGDGYGSMPPDMAQWVSDRHARSYNWKFWRTDRCALTTAVLRRRQACWYILLDHELLLVTQLQQ